MTDLTEQIMHVVNSAIPNATYEEARDAYLDGSNTRCLASIIERSSADNPFEYGSAYWQAWKLGFDEWREGERTDREIKATARRLLALVLVANAGPPAAETVLAGPTLPDQGWHAAAKGYPAEACPYPYGSLAMAAWRTGWDKYQNPVAGHAGAKAKRPKRWILF